MKWFTDGVVIIAAPKLDNSVTLYNGVRSLDAVMKSERAKFVISLPFARSLHMHAMRPCQVWEARTRDYGEAGLLGWGKKEVAGFSSLKARVSTHAVQSWWNADISP